MIKPYLQIRNAFLNSIAGLSYLLKNEFAARLEIYVSFWLLVLYVCLGVGLPYLFLSIILMLILLCAEALNTAVEVIVDRVSPEKSLMAKHAKDLGSLAVMFLIIANLLMAVFTLSYVDWARVIKQLSSGLGLLFIATMLFSISIYCFLRVSEMRKGRYFVALFVLLFGISGAIFYASNYFTGNGFDETVIYHLGAGVEGAGIAEYADVIIISSAIILFVLIIAYLIFDVLGETKLAVSKNIKARFKRHLVGFDFDKNAALGVQVNSVKKGSMRVGVIVAVFSILLNPLSHNLWSLLDNRISSFDLEASLSEDGSINQDLPFFRKPTVVRKKRNKKNIIYIYLESLEATYLDNELFPDLAPNISVLRQEAINFSDVSQVFGTGFTIAGIVGSQCGVPLSTSSGGNTLDNIDSFMPNMTCIGDILSNEGYDLTFMGGANLSFAGKGNFLSGHGFNHLIGREVLEEKIAESDKFNAWGLYDEYLFEQALQEIDTLSEKKDPFGFFLLTLDTHHPRGHLSPACKDIKYQDGSNEILNAVKCTDKLLPKFIEELRKNEAAKDTLIVIGSDHLALRNTASNMLKKGSRKNLFMIIDPNRRKGLSIDRQASTLDVAPTIMSLLGLNMESFGYGRNLLSQNETLIEKEPKRINGFLRSQSSKLEQLLWNYPSLSDGIHVNTEQKSLGVSGQNMNFPMILKLNDNLSSPAIEGVIFDHPNVKLQEGYLSGKLPDKSNYIWIDDCADVLEHTQTNLPDSNVDTASLNESAYCSYIKNRKVVENSSYEPKIIYLSDGQIMSYDLIVANLR